MILVTGGAGFIGSHLCERLLFAGREVLCFDNFNNYYDPQIKEQNIAGATKNISFTLVRGDILDIELLDKVFSQYKPEKIVHLAAIAGVRSSLVSPAMYADVDIKGTINLLEAGKKYKVKQFIFGSSSSVYGINKKVPFSEDDPADFQVSPYAVAKKAGELYYKAYHHLYGIPTTILRFFTVYGPRQRPDMAIHKFTRLMMEGKPVPMFGNGSSERDYTYVDDCVDGIMAAINKPLDFEIINLGNSTMIQLKDLIALIAGKLGKHPEIEQSGDQSGDVPVTCADISKATELLDYRPRVQIGEGIERFVSWYSEMVFPGRSQS